MKTCDLCGEAAGGYIVQNCVTIDGIEHQEDLDACAACARGWE